MTSVPIYAQSVIADELVTETILSGEDELMPMGASDCPDEDEPTYVPGIGWTGSPSWSNAITVVQSGGHIQGWGSNSETYLSAPHARLLILAAGLELYKDGNVEKDDYDHDYPHIHYWAKNTRHNSIRVSE
jgi:hypothetical protein